MRAAHAIMRTAEDSEPEFDQITFSLPQLATLLSRQAIWQPTEELDEVGGLTPWIVPRISDFSFEYENYRIGFNQLIQVGMEIKGTEAARTDFSLERADGKPIAVLGCVDLLNDLRLLAEFVNLGHVPMGAMSGWRRLDGRDFREEFPILSWIQASRGLLTARQLKLGIHHLYPNKRTHFISNLSDDISAEDPQRSELICNWLDWIKEPCNRGAVISYLAPFHRENSLPNEMFRWTYEVLQDLCDKPQANSRVAPVDDDEVNRRNETIGLIESALDSHEEAGAADWAIERLRTGSDKKGQARKLSELIEPLEQSLERSLRSRRQDRNLETIESSKKTAKALTKLRGDLSHGTSSESSEDFGWRLDQIHLIVWSLILSEMGYPAALIDKLMFARSYRENWWQGR